MAGCGDGSAQVSGIEWGCSPQALCRLTTARLPLPREGDASDHNAVRFDLQASFKKNSYLKTFGNSCPQYRLFTYLPDINGHLHSFGRNTC
jgi:hypothetical protein